MSAHRYKFSLVATCLWALAVVATVSGCAADSSESRRNASPALPSVDLAGYMGEWHQMAHIPNRFQRQCVSGAKASYKLLPSGQVEVRNECQTRSGIDSVVGAARPRDGAVVRSGQLRPASLEVAFAPAWTRWVPLVWANYDVAYLSSDGRVAIVTEPSRSYMWVLSRSKTLGEPEWKDVEQRLETLGFKRDEWVRDTAGPSAPVSSVQ